MDLKKLNIKHETLDDGILLQEQNNELLSMKKLIRFDDHRIAMSFLVAGIKIKEWNISKNCKNIETSFPGFSKI